MDANAAAGGARRTSSASDSVQWPGPEVLPLSYAMLASTRQLNEHQLGAISPDVAPSLKNGQLGILLVYGIQIGFLVQEMLLTSPAIFARVGALRAALLAAEVRARSRRILRTVGAGTRIKVVAAAHLCVGDGARSPVVPTQQTLIRRHPLVGVSLSWRSVAGALPGANCVCVTQ